MPTPQSAVFLVSAFLMGYEEESYSYPVTAFKSSQDELDDLFIDMEKKTRRSIPS